MSNNSDGALNYVLSNPPQRVPNWSMWGYVERYLNQDPLDISLPEQIESLLQKDDSLVMGLVPRILCGAVDGNNLYALFLEHESEKQLPTHFATWSDSRELRLPSVELMAFRGQELYGEDVKKLYHEGTVNVPGRYALRAAAVALFAALFYFRNTSVAYPVPGIAVLATALTTFCLVFLSVRAYERSRRSSPV